MANIHPDIRPGGLNQRELVTLLYQIVASLKGICAKLDADGGVTDTTYTALCYTALYSVIVTDQFGNRTGLEASAKRSKIINPYGVDDQAVIELMYQITNCVETLTEQLDADGGVADTDYEANCYTAMFLHQVENQEGNKLGNGTAYYFRPGGVLNHDVLIEWLYNCVNAIETLTEQLDADGTVTDTNYEALWFTATMKTRVENKAGSVVGNSSTFLG